MKVYLSGKMRGLPKYNYPRFMEVESMLRKRHGWDVYNPAVESDKFGTPEEIDSDDDVLNKLLEHDLAELQKCDAIYLMNGWETSVGAKMELKEALECGLKVILEANDLSSK